ncbi:MAG: flagellum-specific peptidoglycan hydrolase FlgJ [Saprospiraceae bacterium]|jgi:flagellum-specific peptidoglycan hydrolase FlgJ
MKFLLLTLVLAFSSGFDVRESYIDQYKDLAIIEMERTGVPASIKLAQAILESQSGQSLFALQSKNHFGIKCKEYWRGNMYLQIDDDRDGQGELIESCFRSYEDVINSYVDHSNFLKYSKNYIHLFKLDSADYKGWANGLQEAGYATDKAYGKKLISIIERHKLYQYDEKP